MKFLSSFFTLFSLGFSFLCFETKALTQEEFDHNKAEFERYLKEYNILEEGAENLLEYDINSKRDKKDLKKKIQEGKRKVKELLHQYFTQAYSHDDPGKSSQANSEIDYDFSAVSTNLKNFKNDFDLNYKDLLGPLSPESLSFSLEMQQIRMKKRKPKTAKNIEKESPKLEKKVEKLKKLEKFTKESIKPRKEPAKLETKLTKWKKLRQEPTVLETKLTKKKEQPAILGTKLTRLQKFKKESIKPKIIVEKKENLTEDPIKLTRLPLEIIKDYSDNDN